jgi:hypothetical protein
VFPVHSKTPIIPAEMVHRMLIQKVSASLINDMPEVFDRDLRIDSVSEPLHRETFVSELSVK